MVIFAPPVGAPMPKPPPTRVPRKLIVQMDAEGRGYSQRPLLSDGQPWGRGPQMPARIIGGAVAA
jgi:hypothetical protein